MRRRGWLLVSMMAVLFAVVVICCYATRREPIRVGMTRDEVEKVLGAAYGDFFEGAPRAENGSRVYYQTDFLGTYHNWSVQFDRSDRVMYFSTESYPFSARPPWLEWLWP